MRETNALRLLLALLGAFAGPTFATADGPDFYRAVDVPPREMLNVRAAPNARATKLGVIPPGGHCIRNLGCQGGLSFQEYQSLSPKQQALRLKQSPRWCRVEYRGITGWVAGRYLAEGDCR